TSDATTVLASPSPTLRVLSVQTLGPPKCTTPGGRRTTFTFPFSDDSGAGNIYWLQGSFSNSGSDSTGAGAILTSEPCHFIYFSAANTIYLDTDGQSHWIGSSTVGPGGT